MARDGFHSILRGSWYPKHSPQIISNLTMIFATEAHATLYQWESLKKIKWNVVVLEVTLVLCTTRSFFVVPCDRRFANLYMNTKYYRYVCLLYTYTYTCTLGLMMRPSSFIFKKKKKFLLFLKFVLVVTTRTRTTCTRVYAFFTRTKGIRKRIIVSCISQLANVREREKYTMGGRGPSESPNQAQQA